MDIKALKLELLERIALIDDGDRLLALKRMLDGPVGYAQPGSRLSVVQEEMARYLPSGRENFSAGEVRAIIAQIWAQGADR